jgi:hypothetical protein
VLYLFALHFVSISFNLFYFYFTGNYLPIPTLIIEIQGRKNRGPIIRNYVVPTRISAFMGVQNLRTSPIISVATGIYFAQRLQFVQAVHRLCRASGASADHPTGGCVVQLLELIEDHSTDPAMVLLAAPALTRLAAVVPDQAMATLDTGEGLLALARIIATQHLQVCRLWAHRVV